MDICGNIIKTAVLNAIFIKESVMRSEVPQMLIDFEEQLKNRFQSYLIIATDGSEVFTRYNQNCSAYGMAKMAMVDIEETWRGNYE